MHLWRTIEIPTTIRQQMDAVALLMILSRANAAEDKPCARQWHAKHAARQRPAKKSTNSFAGMSCTLQCSSFAGVEKAM